MRPAQLAIETANMKTVKAPNICGRRSLRFVTPRGVSRRLVAALLPPFEYVRNIAFKERTMATRDLLPWEHRGTQMRRSAGMGDFNSLFSSLQNQIERVFNDVWGGATGEGRHTPGLAATDIKETDDGLEV